MMTAGLSLLFRLLVLFACICLICFSAALFYSKSAEMSYYFNPDGKETDIIETSQHVSVEMAGAQQTSADQRITTAAPGKRSLEPCPATPPGLRGPHLVEFKEDRTMEDVMREVLPLEKGGRYRPSDCIARQKVAIIIPFRNRHEHLKHWLFYFHPILKRQQSDYGVYVIQQYGDGTFNKGRLMNAGFVEALKEYDYDCFVFADVDVIPLDDRNLYRCFDQPRHLAAAIDKHRFRLPYKTYFGGGISLSSEHFAKVNGFPVSYWGWGSEDDDMYWRIIYNGLSVSRPDTITGRCMMIKHERDLHNEENPDRYRRRKQTNKLMAKDGLNSFEYEIIDFVSDTMYTLITVDVGVQETIK